MLDDNGYMLLFSVCLVWCLCYILVKIDEFGCEVMKEYISKIFKKRDI